jgi:hypothetical protein
MKLPDDTLETVRVTRLLPRGGACTMPAHGWVWPHEQTGRFGFVILEGIEPVGSFGSELFDTFAEALTAMRAALAEMGAA